MGTGALFRGGGVKRPGVKQLTTALTSAEVKKGEAIPVLPHPARYLLNDKGEILVRMPATLTQGFIAFHIQSIIRPKYSSESVYDELYTTLSTA
jgi:hypothetical protein